LLGLRPGSRLGKLKKVKMGVKSGMFWVVVRGSTEMLVICAPDYFHLPSLTQTP